MLVHGIEAKRGDIVDRAPYVNGNPLLAERPVLGYDFVDRRPASLLGYPIDDAAATATPENHSIGALQYVHSFNIVKIAEVLNVVAQPIDVKIAGGIIATENHCVPVAFPLGYADTWHV